MDVEKLKYPIGKVQYPNTITSQHLDGWIATIANFPMAMEKEVIQLTPEELHYKYRPEGWTIKQVVNHCIDSHLNSFTRYKLALTEENPTIRPYLEDKWAELPDTLDYDIIDSLMMLQVLHKRWVFLLKHISEEDFKKTFIHPASKEVLSLEENTCVYAWHCMHHLQHIIQAKKYKFT